MPKQKFQEQLNKLIELESELYKAKYGDKVKLYQEEGNILVVVKGIKEFKKGIKVKGEPIEKVQKALYHLPNIIDRTIIHTFLNS